MSTLEDDSSSRFDDTDLDSILARVERRGPLTFTKKRCLYRAKSRSSKKSSSRAAAHKRSMFPPITEKVDEEEAEAEETKRSPESPLTYLYYGLTWQNKGWPEFLGSWAFANGMNSKDFDNISDSLNDDADEDDVFLSDDSLNDADTDFDSEADTMSQPESEGYYGDNVRYNNDLPESLKGGIPNLVFENKNLVRSKGHSDLSCFTTRPLTFIKDENANRKILPKDDSSIHQKDDTFSTDDSKGLPKEDSVCTDSNVSLTSNHCTFNQVKTYTKGDNSKLQDGMSEPLEGLDWTEMCFLLSGSTSLALSLDVAPQVFVFSVFIGQLLYLLIRFLLQPE